MAFVGSNIGSTLGQIASPQNSPLLNWAQPQNTFGGAVKQLIIEIAGILLFTVVAGINDRWANVMIAFLVALWLLALVQWKRG